MGGIVEQASHRPAAGRSVSPDICHADFRGWRTASKSFGAGRESADFMGANNHGVMKDGRIVCSCSTIMDRAVIETGNVG